MTQDHQENLDLLEDQEREENLVVMDHQEQLDLMGTVEVKVCQEVPEIQEHQDQKDNKETVEN